MPVLFSAVNKAFPTLKITGGADGQICGASLIPFAEPGDLVFADNRGWLRRALRSKASVVLTTPKLLGELTGTYKQIKTFLVHENPFAVFTRVLEAGELEGEPESPEKCANYSRHEGCHLSSDAWVAATAVIGRGSIIGPQVYIGPRVTVGERCLLYPGSRLVWNVILESNVIIQSNAVIGDRPFFFKENESGSFVPFPSFGGVRIGARASIGSCSCVDRGVLEDTVIGSDSIIDNLVQIGHGVRVGSNVVIAGQTGIAGHAIIGDRVHLDGQVGVAPNVTIAPGAVILGRAVVSRTILEPGDYAGIRARPSAVEARRQATLVALEPIAAKLNELFSGTRSNLMETLRELAELQFGVTRARIQSDSLLEEDLGADSLDLVEFWMAVEEKYGIEVPEEVQERAHTFGDAVVELTKLLTARYS
jgi:UDP-3-O-[3-hydroxymyristoyl] glucosamine N-acyltransferase